MEKLLRSGFTKKIAVGLVALSVVSAIFLAALVHFYPVLFTDIKISREIQEDGGVKLLPIMQFISFFGMPSVALSTILMVSGVFFLLSRRREALFALLTLVASGINALVKLVISRPRPSDTLITVYQRLTDSSFPSGHVVYYVVFFGFIATTMIVVRVIPLALRIFIGSASLTLVVLVSISRIYLGAHWATDVIGGYCLGFILLYILLHLYFKNFKFEK